MNPLTIRTVLGEFFNYIKRVAMSDDVELVEKWNALPENLRQLIVDEAVKSVAEVEKSTKTELENRITTIHEAYERVLAAQANTFAEPIPTGEELTPEDF